MDKKVPKLAIRFVGDRVEEIQGNLNNYKIPPDYYEILNSYLQAIGAKQYSSKAQGELDEAKIKMVKISFLKNLLQSAVKNKDAKTIFEHLGIKVSEDAKGLMTLSHYSSMFDKRAFSLSDLGINENQLFKKVVKIEGDADFTGSNLSSLHKLKEIGGNAIFHESKISDLGKLKAIGGTARFNGCKLKSFNELEKIGESLIISFSKVENFGNLKSVGKTALFFNSAIGSLNNLEKIGGILSIDNSTVKEVGKLNYIGKRCILNDAKVPDAAYLESISKKEPE